MGPRSEFSLGMKYSLRRKATDTREPLKTHHRLQYSVHLAMTAIVDAFVSIAFVSSIHVAFGDPKLGPGVKHVLLTALKVTMLGHAVGGAVAVGDRCGAQGLLQINQLSALLVCVEVSPVN